jgi:hypothetical protein
MAVIRSSNDKYISSVILLSHSLENKRFIFLELKTLLYEGANRRSRK